MKSYLKKTFFILIIIILLQIGTISSIPARNYLLKTESTLDLISDEEKIILKPFVEQVIPISIIYTYGRLARPEGFPIPSNKIPVAVNFSILENPDWCIISKDKGSFEIPISTFLLKKNESINLLSNLTIQIINTNIPAFKTGIIKCKVVSTENGNIKSSEAFLNVTIQVDMLPILELDVNQSIELKYGEEKEVQFYLENKGNLNLSCDVSLVEVNDNLNVSFNKSIILPIGEKKGIPVHITNKTKENVNKTVYQKFQVIVNASDDESLKNILNKDFEIEINLIKQTLKEDEDNGLLSILIYVVIILIIIPIVLLIFYYRKKR